MPDNIDRSIEDNLCNLPTNRDILGTDSTYQQQQHVAQARDNDIISCQANGKAAGRLLLLILLNCRRSFLFFFVTQKKDISSMTQKFLRFMISSLLILPIPVALFVCFVKEKGHSALIDLYGRLVSRERVLFFQRMSFFFEATNKGS